MNAAIERYAVPSTAYTDLIRLQEELRIHLSQQIDRRLISPRAGEQRMREADVLVDNAKRDRAAGRDDAARRKAAVIEAMVR